MNFLSTWLLSVVAVAFAVALAEALLPADTRVREAGHLVGGLALLLALLGPVLQLREGEAWDGSALTAYLAETEENETAYRTAQEDAFSSLIKERCAAYIEAAAQEAGVETAAQVSLTETETGVPALAEIWLSAPYDSALAAQFAQELGVAETHQHWDTEEMEQTP